MFDKCQEEYEHRVKKDKIDMDDRISLVFKVRKYLIWE